LEKAQKRSGSSRCWCSYVAHDGVRDRVADHFAPQRIGGLCHRRKIAAACGEQADDVSFAESPATRRAVENGREAGARPHCRSRQRS
jgi:hypothetical protein